MSPETILDFVRGRRLAVVATVAADGSPEAALMGIAVTSDNRIVFDTVKSSRKYTNLKSEKRTAIVVGWADEVTVQLEGVADEPTGDDLHYCKNAYFETYPDGRGRESWVDITYIAVRPTWMRYCDYNSDGVGVVEYDY
jgi:general stress protein 26